MKDKNRKNNVSFWDFPNVSILPAALCLVSFSGLILKVQAQIVPDSTLPVNSIVTPAVGGEGSFVIEGGTQAGGNLFHSFERFSVPNNSEAFFNNGLDVQNIFTRITGNLISNIDGTIRANGAANLFLLNPNGIIFGANARLDIGGSFLASTARSFKFADGTEFGTTNIQTAPVLTINVPIGLQYGGNPGEIRIQGEGQNKGLGGISNSFPEENSLAVKSGNTLAFVGGNVTADGGILQAPGGRVELGGLAGEGTVGIDIDNNILRSLSFPDRVERADVSIGKQSGINVLDASGGNIVINARNINISENSLLSGGIGSNLGFVGAKAGDVNLNASGSIDIRSSRLENNLNVNAVGNSSDIKIQADRVSLTDGTILSTATFQNGKAGNIEITAASLISLENGALLESVTNAIGNAGNISASTSDRISITDSKITAKSVQGLAGAIFLNAKNAINISNSKISGDSFQGLKAEDFNNPALVQLPNSITIQAGSIDLNGITLSSTLEGTGFAGYVNIIAGDKVTIANSTLSSNANKQGGTAGYIYIQAKNSADIKNDRITAQSVQGLELDDLGNIPDVIAPDESGNDSDTEPSGGGNITLDAGSIDLNGTALSTSLTGTGFAGNIEIYAGNNAIINNSNILSDADTSGNTNSQSGGTAGYVYINAGKLAQIQNSTITAQSSRGLPEIDDSPSPEAGNSVNENQPLAGGNITIDADSIDLNQTKLSTSLTGNGFAGNVVLIATDRMTVKNSSSIASDAYNDSKDNPAGGIAGIIELQAENSIEIANSRITADSYGVKTGDTTNNDVGEIIMAASAISIADKATVTTQTYGEANAGSITINAEKFSLIDDAQLDAGTFGAGNAGNIFLNIEDVANIVGENTRIFSDVTEIATGNGGSINIQAGEVFVSDGASLDTGNSGQGKAGDIQIIATATSLNRGAITANTSSGDGGNINLRSTNLFLLRGESKITTSAGTANDGGDGGNITINTNNLVALENSDITANAFTGKGGQVRIDTTGIFGAQSRTREELLNISATTNFEELTTELATSDITAISQQGDPQLQGIVEINTPDVDPSAGLVEVSSNLVDATQLAASTCSSSREQKNQFIITGRGGLPVSPNEVLADEATWLDLRTTSLDRNNRSSLPITDAKLPVTNPEIIEAQGWKINDRGQVELVTQTQTATLQSSAITQPQCQGQ